jgi:hypothetical protein
MNEKKPFKPFISWGARPGDLVKIKTTDYRGDEECSHGIIIENIKTEQQTMFPIVAVYVFERSAVEELYAYNIEIISKV